MASPRKREMMTEVNGISPLFLKKSATSAIQKRQRKNIRRKEYWYSAKYGENPSRKNFLFAMRKLSQRDENLFSSR